MSLCWLCIYMFINAAAENSVNFPSKQQSVYTKQIRQTSTQWRIQRQARNDRPTLRVRSGLLRVIMKRDYISKPRGFYPRGWAYDRAGSRDPLNAHCLAQLMCVKLSSNVLTHLSPSRLGWLIGQQQRLSTSAGLRTSSPLYTSSDGVGAQSANAGEISPHTDAKSRLVLLNDGLIWSFISDTLYYILSLSKITQFPL